MDLSETTLSLANAKLELVRYPLQKKQLLRAWDAADEYLLSYLTEQGLDKKTSNALLLNDRFGALGLGILSMATKASPLAITSLSDSVTSDRAMELNAKQNRLPAERLNLQASFEFSEQGGHFDLVLIKVPKSLAQLEDNLRRIRPTVSKQTVIVAAGMTKNIHNSTLELFEKYIGPTKTSLAKKKARLIHTLVDESTLKVLPEPAQTFVVDKSISNTKVDLTLAS